MSDLLAQVAEPRGYFRRRYVFSLCPCGNPIYAAQGKQCRLCWRLSKRSPYDPTVYILDGIPVRRLPLTRGLYALIDARNYDWLKTFTWRPVRNKAKSDFYAQTEITIAYRRAASFFLHSAIFGPVPHGCVIDHRDRRPLNALAVNLRCGSIVENNFNRTPSRIRGEGYLGVRRNRHHSFPSWSARIGISGKDTHLGCFRSPEEAARVRDQKAIEIFGEFAVLNFPIAPDPYPELSAAYATLTGK